mgnify:CR=1 FL=1|jgi:DNA-binding MarR family transcriptional regulator
MTIVVMTTFIWVLVPTKYIMISKKAGDPEKKGKNKENSNIPLQGLLSIVLRNHIIFINKETKHLNLTGGQLPCLIFLSYKQGITQDDIARKLQIDKGAIARSVKKLEDKEFIRRIPDPENRRKYLIFLTEKGEQTIPELKAIEKKWKKIVCHGLTDKEYSQLMKFMNLLAKNSIETFKNCQFNGEN